MTTITLEGAKALSKKHKAINQIKEDINLYTESSFSDIESCAALAAINARIIQKHKNLPLTQSMYGARFSREVVEGSQIYYTQRGKEKFVFEEIPPILLKTFGCRPNNCHQNCINASINGLPGNAFIVTGEISYLPSFEGRPSEMLHTFVELGEVVFDLDLGIRASKTSYYKFFNVNEIARLEAKTVENDFHNHIFEKFKETDIKTEDYLMAREDCIKIASKGK